MKEREQPSLAGSPVSDECTYPGKVPLAAKNSTVENGFEDEALD
ncbi:hypothetical protein OKW39_008587 [Paraburkholderia sp. MM6662-R1]